MKEHTFTVCPMRDESESLCVMQGFFITFTARDAQFMRIPTREQ